MNFFTDIHGPQRMNPTDFCDPLTLFFAKCLDSYWMDCHEILYIFKVTQV